MSSCHSPALSNRSFENDAIASKESKEEDNVAAPLIVSGQQGLKDFEALFPNAVAEQVLYFRERLRFKNLKNGISLPRSSKRIRNKKIAVSLANNEKERFIIEKRLGEGDHSPDLYSFENLKVNTIDNKFYYLIILESAII